MVDLKRLVQTAQGGFDGLMDEWKDVETEMDAAEALRIVEVKVDMCFVKIKVFMFCLDFCNIDMKPSFI